MLVVKDWEKSAHWAGQVLPQPRGVVHATQLQLMHTQSPSAATQRHSCMSAACPKACHIQERQLTVPARLPTEPTFGGWMRHSAPTTHSKQSWKRPANSTPLTMPTRLPTESTSGGHTSMRRMAPSTGGPGCGPPPRVPDAAPAGRGARRACGACVSQGWRVGGGDPSLPGSSSM